MLSATAAASKGSPSWKVMPLRSVMVQVWLSGVWLNDLARYGTVLPLASIVAIGSKMAEPTIWADRAHRPVIGLRLSLSASRPQARVPPSCGVPSSAGRLPP